MAVALQMEGKEVPPVFVTDDESEATDLRDVLAKAAGFPFPPRQEWAVRRGIGQTLYQDDVRPERGGNRYALPVPEEAELDELLNVGVMRGRISRQEQQRAPQLKEHIRDDIPDDWDDGDNSVIGTEGAVRVVPGGHRWR